MLWYPSKLPCVGSSTKILVLPRAARTWNSGANPGQSSDQVSIGMCSRRATGLSQPRCSTGCTTNTAWKRRLGPSKVTLVEWDQVVQAA